MIFFPFFQFLSEGGKIFWNAWNGRRFFSFFLRMGWFFHPCFFIFKWWKWNNNSSTSFWSSGNGVAFWVLTGHDGINFQFLHFQVLKMEWFSPLFFFSWGWWFFEMLKVEWRFYRFFLRMESFFNRLFQVLKMEWFFNILFKFWEWPDFSMSLLKLWNGIMFQLGPLLSWTRSSRVIGSVSTRISMGS